MPILLSLPAEVRQLILSCCLPTEVHDAGVVPRTTTLLPLLLTCKAIRDEVLDLLRFWSPLYHIEDPRAFVTRSKPRGGAIYGDNHDDVAHMRRISLRVFADRDLRMMVRSRPAGTTRRGRAWSNWKGVLSVRELDAWEHCVEVLLRPGTGTGAGGGGGAVESVVLDLTPPPWWLAMRKPRWVRATVPDARDKLFLEGCKDGVRRIAGALEFGVYPSVGREVSISLAGILPCKKVVDAGIRILQPTYTLETRRGHMNMLKAGPGGKVPFAGEWERGPAEEAIRLRLVIVCLCWGVDAKGPMRGQFVHDELSLVGLRYKAGKGGLTTPDLNFKALGEVLWSAHSCGAYYLNAEADERRTREDLIRMLAFAVDVRTGTDQPGATLDFEPAVRVRRLLLHYLAEDLELETVSIGDAGERFVRVSLPVKDPSLVEQVDEGKEGELSGDDG